MEDKTVVETVTREKEIYCMKKTIKVGSAPDPASIELKNFFSYDAGV